MFCRNETWLSHGKLIEPFCFGDFTYRDSLFGICFSEEEKEIKNLGETQRRVFETAQNYLP
jgi:hypothetical protein